MFLPAALEIVETPAPPVARLTILVLTSLLMVGIAWACLGKVDIISAAPGKLIPSGGGKIVQPLETGTVTAIAAYDGQHVSMGQPLIQLEPTETQADRDRLRGELAAAQLNAARLRTLALHVNFTSPQGVEPTAASIL